MFHRRPENWRGKRKLVATEINQCTVTNLMRVKTSIVVA
jgi:hypothetical protein